MRDSGAAKAQPCTCGRHDLFRNCVESFLRDDIGDIISMFTEDDRAGSIRFGEIFYQRMSNTNDILNQTRIEGYSRCLREYLAALSEADLQAERILVNRARQLLDYFITHAQDPDQSLIGLCPAKSLLAPFVDSLEIILAHQEARNLPIKTLPFMRLEPTPGPGVLKREGSTFPHRKNVVDLVLEWSEKLSNLPVEEVMATVNKSVELITAERQIWSQSLSSGEHLRPGALVIVGLTRAQAAACILDQRSQSLLESASTILSSYPQAVSDLPPAPKYCYRLARFAGEQDEQCLLYVCPQEIMAIAVPWNQVIDLPKQSLSALGSLRAMRQLTMDPIDALYSEFSIYAREATHEFLINRGVRLDLLLKALDNKVSITDLGNLKQINLLLQEILDASSDEFAECARQITEETCKHQATWAESYSRLDIFVPTRENRLNELVQSDFGQASRDRLKRYRAIIETALDQLQIHKRNLMNGSQKQQMTTWWLSRIEVSVTDFLNQLGYIANAVSDDYIAQPPKSLSDVKFNLKLIREILDPKQDLHGVRNFTKKLKDEIYPRIHEFVASGRVTLSEHFQVEEDLFDLEAIKEMFRQRIPAEKFIDSKIVDWVDDMIKDMEYLEAINAAEAAAEAGITSGKGLELGPVPISGLILGCFYRLENELLTVLDCWDHLDETPSET